MVHGPMVHGPMVDGPMVDGPMLHGLAGALGRRAVNHVFFATPPGYNPLEPGAFAAPALASR